ncbi:MAG: alanine racemase [Gracilimonas sp.]
MSSTLYIHLSKIGENLKAVNSQIGAGVKRMAVIKDEAYGHGMLPVANYLKDKAEWFCVARIDEAVRLREAGIKLPILVFEVPVKGKEHLYSTYEITASISDLYVFERLEPGTNCHLHFDTGMFRLGILPDQVEEVHQKIKKYSALNYSGIYTHFANADDPNDARVLKQLEIFKSIRAQFPEALLTHTCNSGAIFHYHDKGVIMDAVRPGICLYGFAPGAEDIPTLSPILEWKSELVQVKKIRKGDEVGYGSRWKAPKDGWLGIVPVGYADGIFRNLSSNFNMEIAGEKYPQVGTISMDFSAVFLGDNFFPIGAPVTLLGEGELSAREWAKKIGTIPYEITTAISQKIKREYI